MLSSKNLQCPRAVMSTKQPNSFFSCKQCSAEKWNHDGGFQRLSLKNIKNTIFKMWYLFPLSFSLWAFSFISIICSLEVFSSPISQPLCNSHRWWACNDEFSQMLTFLWNICVRCKNYYRNNKLCQALWDSPTFITVVLLKWFGTDELF